MGFPIIMGELPDDDLVQDMNPNRSDEDNVPLQQLTVQEYLVSRMKVGDIILSTGDGVMSTLQRKNGFRWSDYQHVAVVVPSTAPNMMSLLQTNGCKGTHILHQREFRDELGHELEEGGKVWIRQLHKDLPQSVHQKILDFMFGRHGVVGKGYGTFGDMIDGYVSQELTSTEDAFSSYRDKHGFFCSELVALLYQELGLFPKYIKATSYLPAHFAPEDGFVDEMMRRRGKLGPIIEITRPSVS